MLGLCLLWASAWLVDGAWPSPLASAPRQAMHFGLDGLLVAIVARGPWCARWPKVALASLLLLGVPALLVTLAQGSVSAPMTSALFGLVPIAVVVLSPYLWPANADDEPGLLLPALVGLGGTLLLLPFALPDSYRQAAFMGLVVAAAVSVSVAGLWMHDLLAGMGVAQALGVACAANALLFGVVTVLSPEARASMLHLPLYGMRPLAIEAAVALLYDLPQLALLMWLLRELQPARLAARYFLVPLFTVAEGFVLLRPELTVRAAVGAVLAVAGIWRLLTADEPGLMPR